jgi:hypothetical protein
LLLVFIAATSGAIVSAQRGSARPSRTRARSHFDAMESAWRELRALEVQPADANGAIAAWDRAWARRVARAERDTGGACFALADDCASVEVYVLGCNMVGDVAGARASIFNPEAVDDHDPFAWRRAVADEAARRRAERLSCEDLPRVSWEVFQDACGRWYGTGGTPIVPGTSAPVRDWGLGSQPDCPAISETSP